MKKSKANENTTVTITFNVKKRLTEFKERSSSKTYSDAVNLLLEKAAHLKNIIKQLE
ncbi:MAG: hypothetical protein ACOC4M_04570 [Promethearchaeia archaeon]